MVNYKSFCTFANKIKISLEKNTPVLLHKINKDIIPPQKFTWPFCYEPHPLCVEAAKHLQSCLESEMEWHGEINRGKMFGVLVVRDDEGAIGYLAAYSGQLCGRNDLPGFVPAVYDLLQPDGHFKTHEAEITAVNSEVETIERDVNYLEWRQKLQDIKANADKDISHYKALMAEAKERRRQARETENYDSEALIRESQFMKAELRRKKQAYATLVAEVEACVAEYENRIKELKQKRKRMSDALQHWIFSQFVMLNALGERKDLNEIFSEHHRVTGTGSAIPPSGAGECCAPKLLQYAYANGYKPLCMAEFWYGESPKTEVRHHLHFYPACRSKCKPILEFMLKGLDTDPDPFDGKNVECVSFDKPKMMYEDDWIVVVNKPSGMLSVSGRTTLPAASEIMRLLPIHRLDMDTSGLLMLAKDKETQRKFHAMFENRMIRKRYTALLDGTVTTDKGEIVLPLLPDINDRPRQKVDYGNGKSSITYYKVLERKDGKTLVALYPHTGRTHQLRVHCAHHDGLNAPITGDRLYGKPADRLHLYADTLEFYHPMLKKQIKITIDNK